MLDSRELKLWGQPPPAPRTRDDNNPTLLYSWWCTGFAATIIITRLCGRKTRSNKLFREDWIMMLALIPLFVRMAFIHVVLLYGTNNVQTVGVHYTQRGINERSVGARLVLAARIFYAMFIWTSKLTISEFLKRITGRIWRRSYEITLQCIRVFLLLTFIAVVISTLCECQPFDHYWQVVPDPGPHCRQGYGNLITMGTCDVITDILLIAFPIPIILRAGQNWKRKFQLVSLFSLSVILIIVTLIRVPKVIAFRGRQQYRTVWASSEILASAAVSNAVIIGSFLRDKGTKRNKYKSNSVSDSIERASVRRPTVTALQNTGSDEDLFRFLGIRVPDHLQDDPEAPRPAPVAEPATASRHASRTNDQEEGQERDSDPLQNSEQNSSDSDDSLQEPPIERDVPSPVPSSQRAASFNDVGGLLENGLQTPGSRSRSTTIHSGGGITHAQDFAPSTPSPTQSRRGSKAQDYYNNGTPSQSRRGSRSHGGMLQDIGGLLTPTTSRASSGMDRYYGRRQSDSHVYPPSRHMRPAPTGILGPMLERRETQQSLQDAGGLLGIPESQSGRLQTIMSGGSTSGSPIPRSRNPMLEAGPQDEDFELEDIGGLLSPDHQPDASAAALERATGRAYRRSAPQSVPSQPQASSSSQHQGGWDSLDLPDPGGLLGK